ncbi:MAG: Rpn family recombination-promoting nuclease/putative transposase [Desulfococcaceae bacterium]
MKTLLTPKNDYVFKRLFAEHPDILTDLINCVLSLPQENRIVSVEVKNPDIPPDEIDKKFITLDIRAVDCAGNEYDIEMQVRKYENYPKRSLYYLYRMYGEQLKSGDDYGELHPVIGIHFLDYRQFPGHSGFHYHFRLRDHNCPDLVLTDDLSLHIFELRGIEKHMKANKMTDLLEWLHFFNHAHEEGDKSMRTRYSNPLIGQAFDALEIMSADSATRDLAERREKALKDETMFLNEARRLGRKEGKIEGKIEGREEGKRMTQLGIAEKMMARGLDADEISELTGLERDEIAKMRQNIRKE